MIHYNNDLLYQKDSKFIPVGINSIKRMKLLLKAGGYLFVHKDSSGFVFNEDEVDAAEDGDNLLPVMVVKLRDSGINNYKQAHGLRIRQHFADESIAKTWYTHYVDQVAPIVSDKDHLQGGYLLWKHFLKQTEKNPNITISVINTDTQEVLQKNASRETVTEEELWSQHPDHGRKNIVLLMQPLTNNALCCKATQPPKKESPPQMNKPMTLIEDTIPTEYLEIRFRDIDPSIQFPGNFAIITGYATTNEVWSDEENQAADTHLLESIEASGHWHTRVTGFVGSHAEPGWAVAISLEQAIDLGAQFKQHAIYYVSNDTLRVHLCIDDLASADVGKFYEKIVR